MSSVRKAANEALKQLAATFGVQWCAEQFLPKLQELFEGGHGYLKRITVLQAIAAMAETPELSPLASQLAPYAVRGTSDPVPNVRFTAVLTLQKLASVMDHSAVESDVKPCLARCAQDSDKDVKFFASSALEAL